MGGSNRAENTQQGIVDQQISTSKLQNQESAEDRDRRIKLQQPAIDFNTALSSGDRGAALSAMAPAIENNSRAAEHARGNINDSVGPGAARDFALANVAQGQAAGNASTLNNAYTASFDKLNNIGQGIGSFSLQELGAGIRSSEDSASTNNQIVQNNTAKKGQTLSFLGSLAGAAGSAAGGFLSRPK